MMEIIIRLATEEDFSDILLLIKEFSIFQKTPEKVSVTLEKMIKAKDYFRCFVAESKDKKITGFASFFFVYYSWSGKALYLDDLYVTKIYRGSGIGRKLLDSVINLARDQECIKVRWQVSNWNSDAITFYKKMGATVDATEINCDLNLTSTATFL